jgi:hypothetical protein
MIDYPHIIITSAPRSGSTALAKMLGQQEDLFVMNEMGIYDDWENRNKWRNFIHSKKWINFTANEKIFTAHDLDLYEFREQVIAQKMSGKDIFNWIVNNMDVKLIGDKCPITYLQNMLLFAKKFPAAKFIISIRDGRDVIASQIRGYYRWPPGDPDHADHWMKKSVEEAQDLWLNVSKLTIQRLNQIDAERVFIFKYEDAALNPSKFEKDLSLFLGVDIHDVSAYFKPVNIGKWKESHPHMMNELTEDFKSMLRRFNYEEV